MGHMIGSFKNDPASIKEDIIAIMSQLHSMQGSLSDEDTQHKAILEVYQILVKVLGDEYINFIDQTMEQIQRCGGRKIDVSVDDSYSTEKLNKPVNTKDSLEVDLKMLGGRKILSVNHDFIE
jgi:hypothetical protein